MLHLFIFLLALIPTITAQSYSPDTILALRVRNSSSCDVGILNCAVPVYLEEIITTTGQVLSTTLIASPNVYALSSLDKMTGALERCGDGNCVTFSVLSGVTPGSSLSGARSVFVRVTDRRLISSFPITSALTTYTSVCSSGWLESTNTWSEFIAVDGVSSTLTAYDNIASSSTPFSDGVLQLTSCSAPNPTRYVIAKYDGTSFFASVAYVNSITATSFQTPGSFPSNFLKFKQILVSHDITVASRAWALDLNFLATFTVDEVTSLGNFVTFSSIRTRTARSIGLPSGSTMTGIALSLDEQSLFITTQSGIYSLSTSNQTAVAILVRSVTIGFEYRGVAIAPLKCSPGAPGHYCDATTKLLPCKPGTSSFTAGGSTCTACLLGKIAPNYGMSECTDCPIGSFGTSFSRTTCTLCGGGTYSDTIGSTICKPCSGGIWCPVGSTNNSVICLAGYACPAGIAPQLCQEGTYSPRNSTTCLTCPPGMYCPTKGLNASIPCPRGTYRSSSGASSLADCRLAALGYFAPGNTSFQTLCKVGSYQDFTGQWNPNCIDCGSGTFSNVIGRTTPCELCPAGSYCQNPRSIYPIPCDPGSFSPITGAASSEDCYSCPEGTFATTQGTTGLDVMAKPTLLLNSTTCALCLAGFYCEKRTDEPLPCAAGKFSHETGASTIDTCRNCEPGFWCHEPGTSDETRPCPKGWFCPGKGLASYQCEAGTYSPVDLLAGCLKCPTNTWSDTIGASSNATCRSCPTGTSSDKLGASINSSCYACPPGKYSTGNAQICAICPDGYYCPGNAPRQMCPLHTFNPFRRASNGLLCLACPAGSGTNNTGTGASTECSPKFAPVLVSASISISGISYTSILVAGAKNFTRDVQAIISASINVDPNLVSLSSVKDTSSTGQRLLRFVTGGGLGFSRSLAGSGSILVSIRVSATASTSSTIVNAINGISSSATVVKMIAAAAAVPESSISVSVTSVASANSPTPSGAFIPPSPPTKSEGIPLTIIIGASVGGGVALILILTCVYLRCCRRKDSNAAPSSDSNKTVPTLNSEPAKPLVAEKTDAFAVRNPMISAAQMVAVNSTKDDTVRTQAPPVLLPPPVLMPPPLMNIPVKTEPVTNEPAPFAIVSPFVSEPPPAMISAPAVIAVPTLPPPSVTTVPSLPPPSVTTVPTLPPPAAMPPVVQSTRVRPPPSPDASDDDENDEKK